MKKKILTILVIILTFILGGVLNFIIFKDKGLTKLPKPELTGGERGSLGIDKNINEQTIDKYLNRSDSVYIDVRMLKDEANWEKINGDSYLSGFIDGFEILPYPYLVDDSISPELEGIVGKGYQGKSLFKNVSGKYVANYEESLSILEYFFPKDKYIFLMCGGGGYAGQTKKLLVSLGWDESKIYDVGGYWFYDGANKVSVKREENGKSVYDFWKATYHNIDFSSLKEVQ